ncbi:hypothetical protein JKP88DRAFT_274745 [Tribonema minus]|uniref:Uncharacterized protein n=1 Tax=Tribonema minus TaxID=303371 RepID=A0A836CRB6_9STRA|nr:hypothetical protein JKP88DRAFT_274745 [Tribonema minus]
MANDGVAGRTRHGDLGATAAAAAAAAAARAAPGALDEGHGRGGLRQQLWSHSALGPLDLQEAFGGTLAHDILQVSITRCDPRALGLLPLLCVQATGSRKPLRQIVMDLQSQDSGQPQSGTTPTIKRKRDTGSGGGGDRGGSSSVNSGGAGGQSFARARQWHVGVALSCGLPKDTSMCKVLETIARDMTYTLLHFAEAAAAAATGRSGDGDDETDEEDDSAQWGPELNSDECERFHAAAAFFGTPRACDLRTMFMSLGPALSGQRAAQLAELCAARIADFAHARSSGGGASGSSSAGAPVNG